MGFPSQAIKPESSMNKARYFSGLSDVREQEEVCAVVIDDS
jgi:hypothetical protein